MASSGYNQVSPLQQIRQQQQLRVVNVLLVGRSAVGKTTLARRLCHSIAENTVYRRTERLEIVSGDQSVDGITFHLNVVDTPGIDTYNESGLQQHLGSCFDKKITELGVVVYVSEAGKTNLLDLDLFKQIQALFGERYNQMSTMVLTNSESFASQKLEQFVGDLRSHQDSSHFVNSLGLGVHFFGLIDGENLAAKFPGQDIKSMIERATQKVESWHNDLLSVILKQQISQKSLPLPITTKQINVLLIGKSGVGKTQICRCLFGKNEKTLLQPTTVMAFNSGTLISDKIAYQLNVVDTPGTDSFDKEKFNQTLLFCKAKGIHSLNIILYVTSFRKASKKDSEKLQRNYAAHFIEFQSFLGSTFNKISALVLTKCDRYGKVEVDNHKEQMRSPFVKTLEHGIVEFGWVEKDSKNPLVAIWRQHLWKLVHDSANNAQIPLPQISSDAQAATYGYSPSIVNEAGEMPVSNNHPIGQQPQKEDEGPLDEF